MNTTTIRSAGLYVLAVMVVALAFIGVAALLYDQVPTVMIVVFPLIILAGAVGALRRTYTCYKTGGMWQVWQGASWLLLAFFMIALTGTGSALLER
ncbi:hypothetical protein [Williamsia herbipolensis]|uniref:hypothetical protein n=1 Tax=Williamsia herbipolensis TaxID=1603258 RepID=UPI0005F883A6|nr:hypothetical protein [Williamsia herbipolensis]